MFFNSRHRKNDHIDNRSWFFNAISVLLLAFVFALMAFVLSQFYLTDDLNDKDQALSKLHYQLNQLKISLVSEQKEKQISKQKITALQNSLAQFSQIFKLSEKQLAAAKQENASLQEKVVILQDQLTSLKNKTASLTSNLELEVRNNSVKDLNLAEVTKQRNRLLPQNILLAKENKKTENNFSNHISDFFAKLKGAIGHQRDICIIDSRFVFQSEVLFDPASANLGEKGKKHLAPLIKALKEITEKTPRNLQWILRVDGHTDHLPIHTKFPSNWELSAARAIAVVKYLISEGIPPNRLVAAGFGEFHPLKEGNSIKVLAQNRRIEFKLDQR